MQQQKNKLTIQLHSRKTSFSSQNSGSPKHKESPTHKKSNSYVQLSPKMDLNNGLSFVNEIKECKISSPRVEDLHKEMKKSQFSKTVTNEFQ